MVANLALFAINYSVINLIIGILMGAYIGIVGSFNVNKK